MRTFFDVDPLDFVVGSLMLHAEAEETDAVSKTDKSSLSSSHDSVLGVDVIQPAKHAAQGPP